ncbi:MAG: TatD family hydrolase [Thermoguttaceae bacterium]
MYFTDIHTHWPLFITPSLKRRTGSEHFVLNGTSPEDWDCVNGAAHLNVEITPSYGLHPWYVDQVDTILKKISVSVSWAELLRENLESKPACGVRPGLGEVGLDFSGWRKNKAEQISALRLQLRIAKELKIPVSIHAVKAENEICEIIAENGPFPAILIHSFVGSKQCVEKLTQFGCFFSFSGLILKPNQKRRHETVLAVPLDRILLESDSTVSYAFAEETAEEVDTEPLLHRICRKIAEIKKIDFETLSNIVQENSTQFLNSFKKI